MLSQIIRVEAHKGDTASWIAVAFVCVYLLWLFDYLHTQGLKIKAKTGVGSFSCLSSTLMSVVPKPSREGAFCSTYQNFIT